MPDETPDTGTPSEPETPAEPDTGTPPDNLEAELTKWKAQARKHEERAKANAAAAKELEQVKAASMNEQDRAVAEAKATTRAEVLLEVASERVEDAVRLASAGTALDVDALLEGLDRKRFVNDDGGVDVERVRSYVAGIAPKSTGTPDLQPDLGQGARGSAGSGSDPLLEALQKTVGTR